MKPARFEYHAPETLREALDLLGTLEDVKILAGGQSLIPMMNFRLARPKHLVDLRRLQDLRYVRDEGEYLAIGALTRHADLETSDLVRRKCPVLVAALNYVGHYAIRTRGTIGGSLAHADPAAELPVVVTALDGEIVLRGAQESRSLRPDALFLTYLTTSIKPGEILTQVRLPVLGPRTGWSFFEINRRHGDFAIVCACALMELDAAGTCVRVELALGGVGGVPRKAKKLADVLTGKRITDSLLARAADSVLDEIQPDSDLHASAEYRAEMARLYATMALTEAWRMARAEA